STDLIDNITSRMQEKAQTEVVKNSSIELNPSIPNVENDVEKLPPNKTTNKSSLNGNKQEKKWKRVANWSLLILAGLFIVFGILTYLSTDTVFTFIQGIPERIDNRFLLMLAIGFAA